LREFHPLTRNSPLWSYATNQWLVCFFSVPQMSHDIACRITASPQLRAAFRRLSRLFFPFVHRTPSGFGDPRAGRTNRWEISWNLLLHFIAHWRDSERNEGKESWLGAFQDNFRGIVLKWNAARRLKRSREGTGKRRPRNNSVSRLEAELRLKGRSYRAGR